MLRGPAQAILQHPPKHPLNLEFGPTLVPGLAVLPAAADVGDGEHAAQVAHEDEAGDAVAGRDGDVEAPVAVQEGRVGAVQLQPLLVHHEHGHLGTVLAGVEDLGRT